MVHFEDLPFELHRRIDAYLGVEDHFVCKSVCQQWYGIFDGFQIKATTIDSPASIGLLSRNIVARTSGEWRHWLLKTFLSILEHKLTKLAFPEGDPSSSTYTRDGIRRTLHITHMLPLYGHSLSSLVISYPTSRMNVCMDALVKALPPGLNTLALHQIDIPLSVLDLEHLYNSCGHLSSISLQGTVFRKMGLLDLQFAPSYHQKSITSLELDFDTVDSVRQIMEFITIQHVDRHSNLQHVKMDFGHLLPIPSKKPALVGRVDDCPTQLYDIFAKQCRHLVSLSFCRVTLEKLLDALYYQVSDQYRGPVRLTINRSIIASEWFADKFKDVIGQLIESVSVVGRINRNDMTTLCDLLVDCKHLQHLELYGQQKRTREEGLMNMASKSEPINFRRFDFGQFSPSKQGRLRIYLPYIWNMYAAHTRFIALAPGQFPRWIWLLDSLPNSFTSLTLSQLPTFIRHSDLYLSTRLRNLTLQKITMNDARMKIIFLLDALVNLHLDQCFNSSTELRLNFMASKTMERLEISQLTMQGYNRGRYYNTSLATVHLLQMRSGDEKHVERKFRNLDCSQGVLFVVCNSLQDLVVDGKNLLG
ncbi:unnamed protein product [Absidia cylindrospora]